MNITIALLEIHDIYGNIFIKPDVYKCDITLRSYVRSAEYTRVTEVEEVPATTWWGHAYTKGVTNYRTVCIQEAGRVYEISLLREKFEVDEDEFNRIAAELAK